MRQDTRLAAEAIARIARKHRDETEAARRLAPPVVAALVEAGLHRMALSRALGGLESPAIVALEVYEELAGAEASLPWIAWNNALVCFHARFMSPIARKTIFEDPHTLFAQSTRPSGRAEVREGRVRISGRWSLVSGCELADWLLLSSVIERSAEAVPADDGSHETAFVLLRRGQVEILDTWHVGGLRGTGSHDVVVTDQEVSDDYLVSTTVPTGPTEMKGGLDHVAINANLLAGFAAQTLGVARAALEAIVAQARSNITHGPMPDLRDRADAQASITLHGAALAAARQYLHRSVEILWQESADGRASSLDDIACVMGAALHANQSARAAVDEMYALGGTRSLYTDGVLERAHRDLHAMLRHIVAQPLWAEDAGRVRFGLEPLSPMFAF
jgi:alkylation response protein AidB-like acyl-CoA dehydrogenase